MAYPRWLDVSIKFHFRLDEAIKEIRRLEEINADLEIQVHRSNTNLNISQSAETELKIYSQKLNSGTSSKILS